MIVVNEWIRWSAKLRRGFLRLMDIVFMSMILLNSLVGTSIANDVSVITTFDWDVSIKGEALEYEYKASDISKDNGLWLAVGTRARGQLGGPQDLWLWKLDNKGKKTYELKLENLVKGEEGLEQYEDVEDMATLNDGSVVMILSSRTGFSVFTRFNEKGRLVLGLPIKRLGRGVLIKKVIPISNNQLLLIGKVLGKAAVIKVDHDGEVIWEKFLDHRGERISMFTDGVVSQDGGFLLLGNGISENEVRRIWMVKYDVSGKLQFKHFFDGEVGYVAYAKDGGHVVIHNNIESGVRNVLLRKFSPSLKELWKNSILKAQYKDIPTPLNVARTSNGDYFVLTSKELQLFMAKVGDDGKMQWSGSMPRNKDTFSEILWNFDLLVAGSTFTVPITILVVSNNEVKEQRQEVRVIRFQINEP